MGDGKVAEERSFAVDVRPGPGREGQERSQEGALGREGEEAAPTPPPGRRNGGPGRRRVGAPCPAPGGERRWQPHDLH